MGKSPNLGRLASDMTRVQERDGLAVLGIGLGFDDQVQPCSSMAVDRDSQGWLDNA